MLLQSALSSLFARANEVGVAGIFQFVFSGQQHFWVRAPASAQVHTGRHPQADVTIAMDTSVFLSIMRGKSDIEALFAQGQLKISGRLGLATLLPQLVNRALYGGGGERVEMDRRYPARPRFSEQLSASLDKHDVIERRAAQQISVHEFTNQYRAVGKPLVLSSALDDWPLAKMSVEQALEHFSDVQGISRHGQYADRAFLSEREFKAVKVVDFVAGMKHASQPTSDEPAAYMGNNQLPRQWMHLIRFPELFERSQYIAPRFWLGPVGTLTPLHRDDSDNLFAQVWGEKSILLAAPHHREALGSWATSPDGGLEGCDFNPGKPNWEDFPAARNVDFLHVRLGPGDLLFLPEGWFHQVSSLTMSLSINFWTHSVRVPGKDCFG
ncbi:cupin-like domain-containing protein [Pseudomonas phoenicis]|uniref:cupin-like domain-containing protein n=1 Tax=unclassified Pseudomonas TaxID=196821 RepID=UPI0039A2ED5C